MASWADGIDEAEEAPNTSPPTDLVRERLQRLLDAPNEFEMLNLAVPGWDELGDPIWGVTDEELKAACKKCLLLAHPDKNVSQEELAARVFEVVNKAVKTLTDLDTRETVLRQYVEKARKEERANFVYVHPQAHLESDLQKFVDDKKKKETLTSKHFDIYTQRLSDKFAERAKRKQEDRERKAAALRDSSSSDEEDRKKRAKARRRKDKRGAF